LYEICKMYINHVGKLYTFHTIDIHTINVYNLNLKCYAIVYILRQYNLSCYLRLKSMLAKLLADNYCGYNCKLCRIKIIAHLYNNNDAFLSQYATMMVK